MKKTLLLTSSLAVFGLSLSAFAGEEIAPIVAPEPSACPWSLGAELLYLKAHDSYGYSDDQDEQLAYRITAAYKKADNLGIRLRYFDFEGDDPKGSYEPEIRALDLEVFDDFKLGAWQGEYAIGLRYFTSELTYNYEDSSSNNEGDFDGWGPTLALELVRPISDSFSVYANGRVSMVFGDDDYIGDNVQFLSTELGLGLQYDFALGNCDSNVRLGIEAQNHENTEWGYSDMGLFGLALGFNFNF